MRYVGYIRVSHEDQLQGYSLDAQERAIKEYVARQSGDLVGEVVQFYCDEAKTATNDNRPALRQLRLDAKRGKFEGLVVHKFDRLARNRAQAIALKTLLRRDLGIKVFSVSEPSEDTDGVVGMLVEGILELVAEWYSKNLSTEFKKGKHEKAKQGKFNGSVPPFGFDLDKSVLIPNETELEGIRIAFTTYAQGKHFERDVAHILNERGYRQKSGELFNRETMRGILQNKAYLGMVKYKPYVKNPDGSRKRRGVPVSWYPGKHQAVISEELFNKCQQVRKQLANRGGRRVIKRWYPLSGILFCQTCGGRMRGQATPSSRYYRCSNRRNIPNFCNQKMVKANKLETQLVDFLACLDIKEWQARALDTLGDLLGEANLSERQTTIRGIIERVDFRFDMGYISKDEYLEKRQTLQAELEELSPIPQDELAQAADMLTHFRERWEDADGDSRKKLLQLVIEKVFVKGDYVVALTLRPSYHVLVSSVAEKEQPPEEKEKGVAPR